MNKHCRFWRCFLFNHTSYSWIIASLNETCSNVHQNVASVCRSGGWGWVGTGTEVPQIHCFKKLRRESSVSVEWQPTFNCVAQSYRTP